MHTMCISPLVTVGCSGVDKDWRDFVVTSHSEKIPSSVVVVLVISLDETWIRKLRGEQEGG